MFVCFGSNFKLVFWSKIVLYQFVLICKNWNANKFEKTFGDANKQIKIQLILVQNPTFALIFILCNAKLQSKEKSNYHAINLNTHTGGCRNIINSRSSRMAGSTWENITWIKLNNRFVLKLPPGYQSARSNGNWK